MHHILDEDYRVCQEHFCLNAAKESREKSPYFIRLKEKKQKIIEKLKVKESKALEKKSLADLKQLKREQERRDKETLATLKRLEREAEKEAKITKREADKLRRRIQISRNRLQKRARRAEEDITPVHCGFCHKYYKNRKEYEKHLKRDFHKRNVVRQGTDIYVPRDAKGRCKECGTYAHRQTCSFLAKIIKARDEQYVKDVKRRKQQRIASRKRRGSTLRDDDYYTRGEEE